MNAATYHHLHERNKAGRATTSALDVHLLCECVCACVRACGAGVRASVRDVSVYMCVCIHLDSC